MIDELDPVLRPETAADIDPVRALIGEAFAPVPYASGTEAAIVDALRGRNELVLSIVAERAGRIVGHAAVSPVRLSTDEPGWVALGPVAVAPRHQRTGVGAALVRHALELLGERVAVAGCVVLGDPAYYARFGFRAQTGLVFDGAPAAYFQSLPLTVAGRTPSAAVSFSPAFDA